MALHVHLVDLVSPSCGGQTEMPVVVALDGAPIGEVSVPCASGVVRAPPSRYVVVGPPDVAAGVHEIAIRADLPRGTVETSALVSLPAIDFLDQGNAVLGAEVVVELSAEAVHVGPPLVYPPKGL